MILDYFENIMNETGLDYFCIKDADEHNSEYVCDEFKFRTVLSGFTGSNGTLIVGKDESCLFTDGRYFIQAANELKNTGIKLMKMNTPGFPSLEEYIGGLIKNGKIVGYYPRNFSYKEFKKYKFNYADNENSIFKSAYFKLKNEEYKENLFDSSVYKIDDKLAGANVSDKLAFVRNNIRGNKCDFVIVSSLDSNMWLYNIRGKAIKYNPVAMSYSYISEDEACLFVKDYCKYKNEFEDLTDLGIKLYEYEEFYGFVSSLKGLKGMVDENSLCAYVSNILLTNRNELIDSDGGIGLNKCIKNDTEIQNIKRIYLKDSFVLREFLDYVSNNDLSDQNEYTLSIKLDSMRLADEECFDLSFDTISASGPNGAMMHYEATKESNSKIQNNNLYLVDSGGQWYGGTTDVTRTVCVGNPTYEMQHDYTLVLRGLLNLQNAVFIEGCNGRNLDTFARAPLWREFSDYKCGTGHGIGYMLNVHEGPFSISKLAKDVEIKPGMIVSDEPGIYKENKYGIRLENILLCVIKGEAEGDTYLGFEPLTYVPFDEKLILRNEMNSQEIKWLDEYQEKCIDLLN